MNATADTTDEARPADPGDLGRRITARRERLGLSRAETAARAGMAEGFLEYLETSPTTVAMGPLLRLAAALDTSAAQLLGGGVDLPAGRGAAATGPRLEELSPPECWARIETGGIARVALATAAGPTVLPVNYRVLDGTVLFRTSVDGPLAGTVGQRVAVEIDRVDEAMRTGWSVLVTGDAHRIDDEEAVGYLLRHGNPDPWAGGRRGLWIRIRPTAVTGRIITTEAP